VIQKRVSRSSPMGMVAPRQRIASAFTVFFGLHGSVSRYAQERGVCRQWVYREANWVANTLEGKEQREEIARLQARVRELTEDKAALEERLAVAVVLDDEKQAEFASVGQGRGVSLPDCWALLQVLIPGKSLSVPTLGRRTQAVGAQSAKLLPVLDEWTHKQVRDAGGDEIYVSAPVLMVVELESLSWLTGRLVGAVTGEAWAKEFGQFPSLQQVTRDAGKALEKGVALVNAERAKQGQPAVVDQGDHYHALRGSQVGFHQAEVRARKALAEAEAAQKESDECQRQGQAKLVAGKANTAQAAWRRAERAMDHWLELEHTWERTKEALRLFTPTGELNTRQHAEAELAETLPQLPDTFAKPKRMLQKAEILNYLDHAQRKLEALPFPQELKQAAVRQEGLRRRPELLRGEGTKAAALRGVMLACTVALAKAGELGQQTAAAVHDLIRRAYRASSLVECVNSVVRMQQSRHRKMTQGMLDLKRLYWNCHTFRTGHRRGTTPYQRLGVPLPAGLTWWQLLKLTPEQLREKLSTAEKPP
jgi:hypothetical protein